MIIFKIACHEGSVAIPISSSPKIPISIMIMPKTMRTIFDFIILSPPFHSWIPINFSCVDTKSLHDNTAITDIIPEVSVYRAAIMTAIFPFLKCLFKQKSSLIARILRTVNVQLSLCSTFLFSPQPISFLFITSIHSYFFQIFKTFGISQVEHFKDVDTVGLLCEQRGINPFLTSIFLDFIPFMQNLHCF